MFGVKGKSILSTCINIVQDIPIDYMHAILEGVSKSLLSTYFDSTNHKYRFYLGRITDVIDERIQKIRPPPEFRRSPRSVTCMKQWKASEHRAWLLYYALPVLSDLLPPDYIYHLSLLVSAMHILLGDSIPSDDVDKAHQQLQIFVSQLYYPKMCGTNIHNLIHISQFVFNWGLLWSYSLFGYESMNGHLRKNCHGTGYVLPQLVHAPETI